jgi:hypothetical protein
MPTIAWVLLASAVASGAVAQTGDNAGSNEATPLGVPAIQFRLTPPGPPGPPKEETLPQATTLKDLTFAKDVADAAKPTATPSPEPVRATKPKPKPKWVAKAAATPAAPVVALGGGGQPMSAWRRAYIAKHGHQPPVPAPR